MNPKGDTATINSATWNIDPSHTAVEFSVRHMMFATVKGRFGKVTGTVSGDVENPEADFKVDVTIDAASIDTRDERRDEHLRSADFFEVDKYPNLKFESTSISKTGDGTYNLSGNLTIRDVTRPIVLAVTYQGRGKDPWGGERSGFSAEGKINRKDYGLTWNAPLEAGGVLVSDEVKIHIEAELVRAG